LPRPAGLSESNPSKWPVPETRLEIGLRKLRDYGGGAVLSDAEAKAVLDEIGRFRRALVAHHDLATLSDEVIREYDWRECPVCRRVRGE
jgi:hypothetical protein